MQKFRKITIPKQRLADKVYQQILNALHNGDIAPNEKIVQDKLAEDFQISRTPIREALMRLEQEGVLVMADSRGFQIRQASPTDIRNIYQARKAIEGYCAGLLAIEAKWDRLEIIKTTVRENEAHRHENVHDYYEANLQIHRAFVEQTGNQYLLEMFDAMWNRSLSFHIFRGMGSEQLITSLTGHMALCEAIETGDGDVAAKAMRDHIDAGLELQLKAYSKK